MMPQAWAMRPHTASSAGLGGRLGQRRAGEQRLDAAPRLASGRHVARCEGSAQA